MNGLFNDLLKVDVVADGAAGRPVFGRKAFMPFLLIIATCFVGGLPTQARAQTVHDQGPGLLEAVSSPGGGNFSNLEDNDEIINEPQIGFGSINPIWDDKELAPTASLCSSGRIWFETEKQWGAC